ncbi:hypothetical protein C8R44DRAFT_741146 [Mycena epipterygia]|nr:hypothetical protein C8R44DRAFT_741146 [Mycena epipterygia]
MLEFHNFLETDTRIFGHWLSIEKPSIDGNWSREIGDFSADTKGRLSPILRPVFKGINNLESGILEFVLRSQLKGTSCVRGWSPAPNFESTLNEGLPARYYNIQHLVLESQD